MRLTVSGQGGASAGPPIQALADAFVEFERRIADERPSEVLLTDDSDRALAAGLVALKLLIPVLSSEEARDRASANGRLIAQLTDSYTPPA